MGPQSPERYRPQNDLISAADQFEFSRDRGLSSRRTEGNLLDMPPRRHASSKSGQQTIRPARSKVDGHHKRHKDCVLFVDRSLMEGQRTTLAGATTGTAGGRGLANLAGSIAMFGCTVSRVYVDWPSTHVNCH